MNCDIQWAPVFAGIGMAPNPHFVQVQFDVMEPQHAKRMLLGVLQALVSTPGLATSQSLQTQGPGRAANWFFRVEDSHEVYVKLFMFRIIVELHVIDIAHDDTIRESFAGALRRWCLGVQNSIFGPEPFQTNVVRVLRVQNSLPEVRDTYTVAALRQLVRQEIR